MNRLFDIDSEGDVKLQDDTFLLIPELKAVYEDKKLGSKAIRWIVLVCDYNSPYRQLLREKREEEVSFDIYDKGKVKELDCDLIKAAVEKYGKLQYEPIFEQYIIYTEKIAQFNEYMRELDFTKENTEELQKQMISQKKVIETREEIKEMILKKKEEEKIGGGGDTTFIEQELLNS
jgi:hypothetical protein